MRNNLKYILMTAILLPSIITFTASETGSEVVKTVDLTEDIYEVYYEDGSVEMYTPNLEEKEVKSDSITCGYQGTGESEYVSSDDVEFDIVTDNLVQMDDTYQYTAQLNYSMTNQEDD